MLIITSLWFSDLMSLLIVLIIAHRISSNHDERVMR
jgi:hypothetical protein